MGLTQDSSKTTYDWLTFPKPQQARRPMTAAPAGVAQQQLEEPHGDSTWEEPEEN